jgi:hypothetical protein
MTGYLDIAVVRIQLWLSRADSLRGRRGASAMIREATGRENVANLLTGWENVATRCEEAGHIDGVIPLQLHTDDPGEIARIERYLTRELREKLPAASFRSSRREGETWLAAQDGEGRERDWPAPTAEWPPGRRCEWCRNWPVGQNLRLPGGDEKGLCVDCLLRHPQAGYQSGGRDELLPGTELDLLTRWGDRFEDRAMRVPVTFEDLARLGEVNDNTHLATIHADGNNIGELGKEIHKQRNKGRGTEFDLPKEISDATWNGLLDGLKRVTDDAAEVLPAIAHLVGGDDVLITLPAHRAWMFCGVFQRSFTEGLRKRLGATGLRLTEAPSTSVGIVFHHFQRPLSQAADLAQQLLDQAKWDHQGKTAALAWLDTTHDGPQPLPDRPSLVLDELDKMWDRLDELTEYSASRRANLAGLTRIGDPDRLKAHARRLGLDDIVGRFAGQPLDLGNALGMVRWWRKA